MRCRCWLCATGFIFSLLLPQLKYSTLNAERHKKLLCMSWEGIQGEIQGENSERFILSRCNFNFLWGKNILHTRFFWSVLRDYQLWNKLYLILVGERFIEFNKNILWTLFYGPTLSVATVPRALTKCSWPQKGLDYFLLALPVSWAKTHAKQLPNSFYLRFCVWLNNFIIDTQCCPRLPSHPTTLPSSLLCDNCWKL